VQEFQRVCDVPGAKPPVAVDVNGKIYVTNDFGGSSDRGFLTTYTQGECGRRRRLLPASVRPRRWHFIKRSSIYMNSLDDERTPFGAIETFARIITINAGTGPCSLCGCDGYTDDGTGFLRCKCGDRKMDHRGEDDSGTDAKTSLVGVTVRAARA
jgi:hypothetical protein